MQSSVVAAFAGYTRNAVALRAPCALILTSGVPDAWERHGLLMEDRCTQCLGTALSIDGRQVHPMPGNGMVY